MVIPPGATVFLGVIGVAGGWYGFNRLHRYTMIQETPRSKVRSMAMGLVELHGTVKAEKLLTAPFSKRRCVYYGFDVQEYRAHTTSDGKGHSHTSYRWDTIRHGDDRVPFWAEDETGKAVVDPTGAEFQVPERAVFYQRRTGIFGVLGALLSAVRDKKALPPEIVPYDKSIGLARVGDRRFIERTVEPDETLFVLGTAMQDGKGGVKVAKGTDAFIVSDRSEREVLGALRTQAIVGFIIAAIGLGGVLAALFMR